MKQNIIYLYMYVYLLLKKIRKSILEYLLSAIRNRMIPADVFFKLLKVAFFGICRHDRKIIK